MGKTFTNLNEIKAKVKEFEGKEVIVLMRESRGKIETHQGLLRKTFQSFFNVEKKTFMYGTIPHSFTYSDILTGEIVLQLADNPEVIIENQPEIVEGLDSDEELDLFEEELDEEEEDDDVELDIDKIKEEYLEEAI